MPTLTLSQKANRVTTFLTALRVREIAGALVRYGFSEADRRHGYALLERLSAGQLEPGPTETATDPRILEELDRWENQWFPVVDATLRFRFPDLHHRVMGNLSQTSGAQVVVSVGELLRRLDAARAEANPQDLEALDLLETRGLGERVVLQARELLDRLKMDPPPLADPAISQDELDAAERELWEWYLEWSQIARVAISDGRLLRRLGFRQTRRDADKDDPSGTDQAELVDAIEGILEGPDAAAANADAAE